MARRKKNISLTSEQQRVIRAYLSLLGLDGKQAQFIMECISYGVVESGFVEELEKNGRLSDMNSCRIFTLLELYENATPQIMRLLLGKFSSRQRRSICSTAGLGRIELYVHNLLKNAAGRGEVLRTDRILRLLERNFGIDMSSRSSSAHYTGIVNRMRRRVWNERYYRSRKRTDGRDNSV